MANNIDKEALSEIVDGFRLNFRRFREDTHLEQLFVSLKKKEGKT